MEWCLHCFTGLFKYQQCAQSRTTGTKKGMLDALHFYALHFQAVTQLNLATEWINRVAATRYITHQTTLGSLDPVVPWHHGTSYPSTKFIFHHHRVAIEDDWTLRPRCPGAWNGLWSSKKSERIWSMFSLEFMYISVRFHAVYTYDTLWYYMWLYN